MVKNRSFHLCNELSVSAGTYGVLFGICVHILLYSRRSPGTNFNLPLLCTAVAMFTMSTMHVSVGLVRGLTAFIDRQDAPGGAIGYYAEIWLWISIFKQALYATNKCVQVRDCCGCADISLAAVASSLMVWSSVQSS